MRLAGSRVLKEPAGNPPLVAEAASADTEEVGEEEDEVLDVVVADVVVVVVDDDDAAAAAADDEVVASGLGASPALVGSATLDGTLLGPEVSVPFVALAEPGPIVSERLGLVWELGWQLTR